MTLRLFNTLTRTKEPFFSGEPRPRLDVCLRANRLQLRPYRQCPPGSLYRLLKRRLGSVVYARNFTDVDDKIDAAAKEAGQPIATVTERYIEAYRTDTAALGVLAPDLEPRATEHIPESIGMVARLIARDHGIRIRQQPPGTVPAASVKPAVPGTRSEVARARIQIAAPHAQAVQKSLDGLAAP